MSRLIGLNFHGIGTPARDLEPGEAPYWLTTAQAIKIFDHVAAAPDPLRYVLTFDDGNLSDHDIALPALVERGLSATFFVLTGRIGAPGSLDGEHIRALRDAGMRIGSHGIAHVTWPTLTDADLWHELSTSRAELERICNGPITEAGIPFGRYDARVLRALRKAGYTAAYSSDGGLMRRKNWLKARSSLRTDAAPAKTEALLAGRQSVPRRLRRLLGMARRRWLPLR